MQRKLLTPNRDLAKAMEDSRFDIWNMPSTNGRNYFSDDVYYEFTEEQVETLYEATAELHAMSLDYVADTIKKGDYQGLGLNQDMISVIEATYNNSKDKSLYGRFDFALDSDSSSIKLLEYNADTPTSLYESSIIQWEWKEHYFKEADQYNSIHEELIERWKAFPNNMYFTAHDEAGKEDWITLYYLLDTYLASGNKTGSCINIKDLGVNSGLFVDMSDNIIDNIFKLYPWEFMQEEQFIKHTSDTNFIEPAWKILLSNKSLLPQLWERHNNHPLLLESHFEKDVNSSFLKDFIKKPIFSREGANVSSTNSKDSRNKDYEKFSDPMYDASGYILQKDAMIKTQDGMTPVIGSWVIGDEPCGISIREDVGFTKNTSTFVPHIFI